MPVTSLGAVVADHAIRFLGHDTHAHDLPHLVYVVSGSVRLTADGEEFTLKRHEGAWLAAHVPHAVHVDEGGMVLGPMLDAEVAPRGRVQQLGVVPALVDVMTTVLGAAPATDDEIEPFRRAIGRVLRTASSPYFAVSLPTHPAVRVLAREAARSTTTLERLAARHRMSARQVQRVFHDETGYTFTRWRTRVRLNVAVAQLLSGGEVMAASRAAGFATRTGLLRALSRESGIAPAALADDASAALAAHRAGDARESDDAGARRAALLGA